MSLNFIKEKNAFVRQHLTQTPNCKWTVFPFQLHNFSLAWVHSVHATYLPHHVALEKYLIISFYFLIWFNISKNRGMVVWFKQPDIYDPWLAKRPQTDKRCPALL